MTTKHQNLNISKPLILSVLILLAFIIAAMIPQYIAPYNPDKRFVPYLSPSSEHFLGTDDVGHDVFSLLVYGTRISLIIGFCAGGLSMLIGIWVGVISGYVKGRVDDILMGITDIVLIIPKIPVIIVIAAFFRPNIWILICILGLFSWESTARLVRAKTLQLSSSGFVLSARCLGFSPHHVMLREIIPVIYPIILPKGMLIVAGAMISEASLSFLGLSDPTMESWGKIISDAFTHGGFVREMWWWVIPPALCISLVIISFVRIGMIHEQPEHERAFE
ncbi:MAG TPA: ABC transporter permease [Methanospirillum sp.]|uniref:ABC transporter permease n=1 Tax=Methanospirillum sp. TaxID=45200 RepID=UPI002B71F116|nr:ABC transporter permease [Methanospirillum sp.]HWQ63557.1 ABC transporter permease [Methanospirillum sp.]